MHYLGLTTQEPDDTLAREFTRLHGYPPEEVKRYWQTWTATKTRFVKLGPVYKTASVERGEVLPGMMILLDTLWHCIALVDGPTVLTDTDTLLDLPEVVTVRL